MQETIGKSGTPRRQRVVELSAALGIALLLGVLVLWILPSILNRHPRAGATPAELLTAMNGTRVASVALLAGLAAFGTLAYTIRTYSLSLSGQVTERYTRAVDQIGSDKLSVRLGGIYALERIALDSSVDATTVVDVLAAFVRLNAPANLRLANWPPIASSAATEVTADVQGALTVLARRQTSPNSVPLDLRNTSLIGANLESGSLQGALLHGANMRGAHLSDSRLERAVMDGAVLVGADLSSAHLLGARLNGVELRGADLYGAHLEKSQLTDEQRSTAKNAEHAIWYKQSSPGRYVLDSASEGSESQGT